MPSGPGVDTPAGSIYTGSQLGMNAAKAGGPSKDVHDADDRRRVLEGAFQVDKAAVAGQAILLFDDLYRSGATMNAIAEVLAASGASCVYAFTKTKTRK